MVSKKKVEVEIKPQEEIAVQDSPISEEAKQAWPDTSVSPEWTDGIAEPELAHVDSTANPAVGEWDSGAEVPTAYSPLVIQTHGGSFDPDVAKILAYGESGTGKTRFASTFPDVIFADIDKGMSSVTLSVDKVDINKFEQLVELQGFLESSQHSYSTVVIDTLNEMQRLAMHATVENFKMIRRSYDDLPSQSDYGKMLHDMVELTRKFIALPMRVVLLAQVTTKTFDTDILQPQLVGKNTAREICRKMDVIGYTFKTEEGEKSKLSIAFDAPEFVTKDRSYRLPVTLPDPSYARMAAYWK